MRPLRYCSLLLLITALLLPQAALSADRIVLLESFTNTSCGPCATSNPVTEQFVVDYGTVEPVQVINVQYHVWWPGSSDPMYVAARDNNIAAVNYYEIGAVPDLVTDGENTPTPGDYDALVDVMNDRLAVDSPFTIDVTQTISPDCQITVEASVTAVSAVPSSGLVVRMALVQTDIHYDSPPGTNGETDFYCTMRDMLPDFNGTPLTISMGENVVVSETKDLDPSLSKIYAVAWVQDTATNEVLQSARSWPVEDSYWLDYDLAFDGIKSVGLTELGSMVTLNSVLENTGLNPDTFDINMDRSSLPLGWTAVMCINGECLAPFITEFVIELQPQETADISVEIIPEGSNGTGIVPFTVAGRGSPCVSAGSIDFTAVTTTAPLILVDDDGGYSYQNFYTQTLTNLGQDFLYWDLNWGKLSSEELSPFDTVIWFTGRNYSSVVDDVDQAALSGYLDGGGHLFMSGQMVGYSTYTYFPVEGPIWHETYLGSEYGKYGDYVGVTGVADDPITNGLVLDIVGGDGADNQVYASRIDPFGAGVSCFDYSDSPNPCAAVHLDTGTFRTVYFAFSFEGISNQADRDLVMTQVLDWLSTGDPSPVTDGQIGKAFLASMPEASPNPFNPSTTIKFSIGGSQATDMNVTLFDMRGHLVKTLHNGPAQPGLQTITWDGLNDAGESVASGVYLTLVRFAEERQSLKITLTK